MSADDATRLALAALTRVAEPGDPAVAAAVAAHGPVEVWRAVRAGVPRSRSADGLLAGIPVGTVLRAEGLDPAAELTAAAAVGARLVCPQDDEWPAHRLTWAAEGQLGAPPLALWVRGPGRLADVVERSVAVVGARAATSYGAHVATGLGHDLAARDVAVVSGGAYGIDGHAHRGALAAGGAPTVAVLACGVDVAYPRGHDRLLEQIAATGLLVSELPPGSHPTRSRFLVRNRVIAALSLGTVVVEAAARSGSLATLSRARQLGRHVMAVPGPVTSAMSTGCHAQLREGATCVTSAAEVLDLVGRLGQDAAPEQRGPVDVRDDLPSQARQVLEAVPLRRGRGVGQIARDAGVLPMVVQQVLPPLLAHGLVERTADGYRLTALGSGRTPVR